MTHVSTSSRSLGDPGPTSLPERSQIRTERSMTHISTSSRSLGDPIPTPALGQGFARHPTSQTQVSQHSDHIASQPRGSKPSSNVPSTPLEAPPAVMQKGTTGRSLARGSFLDMAAIDSQRGPVSITDRLVFVQSTNYFNVYSPKPQVPALTVDVRNACTTQPPGLLHL